VRVVPPGGWHNPKLNAVETEPRAAASDPSRHLPRSSKVPQLELQPTRALT
jgi:hypothetical protein